MRNPVLEPSEQTLKRIARAFAGFDTTKGNYHIPVVIHRRPAPWGKDLRDMFPRVTGEHSHHTTKTGKRIYHPSAYAKKGWSSIVYHPSTRQIEVGEYWLGDKRACEEGAYDRATNAAVTWTGKTAKRFGDLIIPVQMVADDHWCGKRGWPRTSAADSAGPWWRFASDFASLRAKSPADAIRRCDDNPAILWAIVDYGMRRLLPAGDEFLQNVLALPPGVGMERVLNAINAIRRIHRDRADAASVPQVAAAISKVEEKVDRPLPPGWRWAESKDAKALVSWCRSSGACLAQYLPKLVNSGHMIRVAVGPDGEVVGIDHRQVAPFEAVCTDRNNRFSKSAWEWASVPPQEKS